MRAHTRRALSYAISSPHLFQYTIGGTIYVLAGSSILDSATLATTLEGEGYGGTVGCAPGSK